jgi:hypothetical protein
MIPQAKHRIKNKTGAADGLGHAAPVATRLLAEPRGNPVAMAICDTCGNDYDKAFSVMWADGRTATFDSIECAAVTLAPLCAQCGCRILGHGVEADNVIYCCAHCARRAGNADVQDRHPAAPGG